MARKIVCRWAPGKRRQTLRCPGCFESKYALAAKIAAPFSHPMNHQGDKVVLGLFAETMKRFTAPGGTRSQPCCHNVGGSIHAAAGLGLFHRELVRPCKLMSRFTLANPALSETVSNIEHVAVDIDEHPDLASKHGVSAVPTFIVPSTADDEVECPTGFQAICDFLPWLTSGISEAQQLILASCAQHFDLHQRGSRSTQLIPIIYCFFLASHSFLC